MSTAINTVSVAFLGLALLLSPSLRAADDASPVGLWKTISDTTGKPAGIVEITVKDGEYSGRIVRSLDHDGSAVCEKCTDARKDRNYS